MPCAYGHRLYDCSSFSGLVLFRVDQIEHINQWWFLNAYLIDVGGLLLIVGGFIVIVLSICIFIVILLFGIFVDYTGGPISPSFSPPTSCFFLLFLIVVIFLARVLV